MTEINGTQTENPNEGNLENLSTEELDEIEDWLGKEKIEDLESDDSPESSDLKEDIKTYQARIDRLDWGGLMYEFKRFNNLESTYNSLIALIGKVEDERYYSILQLDRFKTLNPETQETSLKVKRLCDNILLRYLKENPKYPIIKNIDGEDKILQSLSQEMYENFAIRFSGIEAKLLKLFTGYALKNVEKRVRYKELEKELYQTKKTEKRLELIEKGIVGLEALILSASNLAHAFNLIDANVNNSITNGSAVSAISSLGYCKYRKSEISKEYDKKFEENIKITKAFIADYIGEQRRATEAYMGI